MFGYGISTIGMGTSYNFMSAYLVVFLTNCVGLSGSAAGAISSIALVVEACFGTMVGNWSDNCTSKMGRRRPFMVMAGIGVPISMILFYNTIDAAMPVKIAYYLACAILFRVFFCCYEIPYNALGAEIAPGYDERTKLRTISRAFGIIGNALGYITPLLLLDLFRDNESTGWRVISLFMGLCCCLFWLLCVYFTRGKSLVIDKSMVVKKKNVVKSILTSYLSLVKLKAMRILMIYKAAFTCAFSLYNVGTIYYLQYSLGLGNTYSSYMYAFQIIIFAITTPLINKMALKMGKAQQQMTALFAGGIVGVAIFIFMPNSVVGSVIYIALFSVVQNGFWQVSTSIFYDVVEVDEYVNYKRREGDIMSLVSVFGTIITAIMVQVFGILLDFAGFNPDLAVQPDSAQWLIGAMYVLVPSICFLIGALALKVFPVNKKTFASLLEVLKLRREGKDYSQYMEDMKKITE